MEKAKALEDERTPKHCGSTGALKPRVSVLECALALFINAAPSSAGLMAADDLPALEPRFQSLAGFDLRGIANDHTGRGIHRNRIPAGQDLLGPKQAQSRIHMFEPIVKIAQIM